MSEVLNDKTITLYEIFLEASKRDSPIDVLKMHINKDSRIVHLLGYAMNPSWKMNLPDGDPPYIPSEFPLGLAEVELLHLSSKIYVLYDDKMPKVKKEVMLIQWMEKMAPDEAKMMIHIKDKTLHTMFSEITEEVLVTALGWPMEKFQEMKAKANK